MIKSKNLVRLPIQFKDRRTQTRQHLTGLMPGKMLRENTGKFISCRPMDITPLGIGILTTEFMEKGEAILLETGSGTPIVFKVEWQKMDFGKQDLIRYGLSVSKDQNIDIIDFFTKCNCLV